MASATKRFSLERFCTMQGQPICYVHCFLSLFTTSDLTTPVVGNLSPRCLEQWGVGEEKPAGRFYGFSENTGSRSIVATFASEEFSDLCKGTDYPCRNY
ncbi:hypothetical protein TNIN_122321 [Trichonephila inaurata madagascariensis]|uniref:Uncharacterized protein n=1 Tax=Trichonephila inaurata madagascariensis TaxID=2747483 RepID=A0A8X6XIP0_9ARAC|nr:hypothetical protein TNIN_122321 [Trichonephila inaurata madagascariensis]